MRIVPNTIELKVQDNLILRDDWNGFPSYGLIRKQCEAVLEKVHEQKTKLILSDLRKAKGTFIHSSNFLKAYYQQLNYAGVVKLAFLVVPNQSLIIRSIEQAITDNRDLNFQIFFEELEAKNWLSHEDSEYRESKLMNNGKLMVQANRQIDFVPLDEIIFIAADGHNSNVHTLKKSFRTNSSLKEINKILPWTNFQRIHKSYIINTSKIQKAISESPYSFVLLMEELPNIKIPIGKKYLHRSKRMLGMGN